MYHVCFCTLLVLSINIQYKNTIPYKTPKLTLFNSSFGRGGPLSGGLVHCAAAARPVSHHCTRSAIEVLCELCEKVANDLVLLIIVYSIDISFSHI